MRIIIISSVFIGRNIAKKDAILEVPNDIAKDAAANLLKRGLAKEHVPVNEAGLRTDGPTIEEFVKAGYKPENYPPSGYTEKPSPGLDAYRAEVKAKSDKAARQQQKPASETPVPPVAATSNAQPAAEGGNTPEGEPAPQNAATAPQSATGTIDIPVTQNVGKSVTGKPAEQKSPEGKSPKANAGNGKSSNK